MSRPPGVVPQQHVSTIPGPVRAGRHWYDEAPRTLDGCCHCDPQPPSSPWGECPQCHRLDMRSAFPHSWAVVNAQPARVR